jgi:hypothetical protein
MEQCRTQQDFGGLRYPLPRSGGRFVDLDMRQPTYNLENGLLAQ